MSPSECENYPADPSSFATSVASRSLTMRQACVAAGICEFLGDVLVGAKVAGTIKNGIITLAIFRGNAGIQLLSFTCALVASASWLMIATSRSWPVSTTYSIVSALAGTGVAVGGTGAVQWGWNNAKGLGAIFAGMIIAPAISAGFGAIVYLISKYAVLERKNPLRAGLIISPIYFFTVAAVLTMSIGKSTHYPADHSLQGCTRTQAQLAVRDYYRRCYRWNGFRHCGIIRLVLASVRLRQGGQARLYHQMVSLLLRSPLMASTRSRSPS